MGVVYLYGFVPRETALPSSGLLGVGEAEVELLPLGDFAAVCAVVPEEDFDGDGLRSRSSNVEWMAEQGVLHEQVVSWFVDHSTIVPSRLLTLFSSEEGLVAATETGADQVTRALRRFDGVREWDLKATWDREALRKRLAEISPVVANLDAEIESSGPGRRYLLQRKRDELVTTETRDAAARLSRDLIDRLRDTAEEVAVQDAPGGAPALATTVALLVRREAEPTLHETVRAEAVELEPFGLTLQLTGPWAPYRFLGPDGE